MSNKLVFNYDEWLSGHSRRKTMMEKLERSLVPFDLFNAIGLHNDKQKHEGIVVLDDNTYKYCISYDYECIGHDVYDAILSIINLPNKWQNILTGYNKFKIVMENDSIKTIYSDKENYFQQIIDMFENGDIKGLYDNRCSYVNNLLARYILLRLIESYRPDLKPLVSVRTREMEKVSLLAADADRKEWLVYSFSKHDALDIARKLDGQCDSLTVIYFYNRNFEKDGNTLEYNTAKTRVISARAFYMELCHDINEQRHIENKLLEIISMLYNEHIEWNFSRIERVVVNPIYCGRSMKEQKLMKKKQKKDKKSKKQNKKEEGRPWWERIPRTLLEDALNVLSDKPSSKSDIFHFLCAANLVNAYINQCNRQHQFSEQQIQRMFQAKRQMFSRLISLATEKNKNVRLSVNSMPAILANITVEGRDIQLSFRGIPNDMQSKVTPRNFDMNGHFDGYFMQPIASALYQYSYMLRWRNLDGGEQNQ